MNKAFLPECLWRSLVQTAKSYCISGVLAFVVLFVASFYFSSTALYYIGGILFLMPIIAPIVTKWIPEVTVSPDAKAVFITGCDRGFGYMLAQRLDKIGFQVFAGCLFPNGTGAESLRKSGSNRIHIVSLDVTNDTSVHEAAFYVTEKLKENVLWAIVNNAGVIEWGEIDWTDMEAIERVSAVNTMGAVRVTKAFLPFLKQYKGRVLTVASIAAHISIPGLVPYCMSKSATISFCDGLRLEMLKWDVQVITIAPAIYRTAMLSEELITNTKRMWEKASQDIKDMYPPDCIDRNLKMLHLFSKFLSSHPNEVISVMEAAITSLHPQYSYTPGSIISWTTVRLAQRIPKPVVDVFVWFIIRFAER